MLTRPCWDQYFMGLAYYTSIRSHDSQTKVGCVIVNEDNNVVSMGYNGFPKGVDDAELPTKRPEKYPFMVHAEENAVSNIITKSCNNLKVYLTHFPSPQGMEHASKKHQDNPWSEQTETKGSRC